MRRFYHFFILGLFFPLLVDEVHAGEAGVVAIEARKEASGRWTFAATVAHADTGWKHYADRFEILAPDGTVLATRVLAHPHVNEQPFTRSLGGVKIPNNIQTVTVRAHDSVHKLGGKTKTIALKD